MNMFFQFLGTSAGEQFPAIWCECETCSEARRSGGPNVRSNAAAFLSPDVLIDFGPEVVMQARRFSLDLLRTKHLFHNSFARRSLISAAPVLAKDESMYSLAT